MLTAHQVLANSFGGALTAVLATLAAQRSGREPRWLLAAFLVGARAARIRLKHYQRSVNHQHSDLYIWYPAVRQGALVAGADSRWATECVCIGQAHYACCCADTCASEVGICSRTSPRLITTLKVRRPAHYP